MAQEQEQHPGGISDAQWQQRLTPLQYEVLRLKGTEPAGSGEYDRHFEAGTYMCTGCKSPLYKSDTKFDSGCGWPAFYDVLPGAVKVAAVRKAAGGGRSALSLMTCCFGGCLHS